MLGVLELQISQEVSVVCRPTVEQRERVARHKGTKETKGEGQGKMQSSAQSQSQSYEGTCLMTDRVSPLTKPPAPSYAMWEQVTKYKFRSCPAVLSVIGPPFLRRLGKSAYNHARESVGADQTQVLKRTVDGWTTVTHPKVQGIIFQAFTDS